MHELIQHTAEYVFKLIEFCKLITFGVAGKERMGQLLQLQTKSLKFCGVLEKGKERLGCKCVVSYSTDEKNRQCMALALMLPFGHSFEGPRYPKW